MGSLLALMLAYTCSNPSALYEAARPQVSTSTQENLYLPPSSYCSWLTDSSVNMLVTIKV